MANNNYGAVALIGGGAGSLDKIDGANLTALDSAFVQEAGRALFYTLDASNSDSENSPWIITPDSNPGTKRWVLQNTIINSGTTLPTSNLVKGLEFLHTPTGRVILYVYDGSAWQSSSIESFGSMTVYVNGTSGADSIDKGGATGTSAFKTIQYAIDTIPPIFNGNVIINISGEDYPEDVVITGKNTGGDYTIQLVGTMTEIVAETTNADVFSTTTIGDTSLSLTASAHIGQVVRISGGSAIDQEAIILSNTTTTLTIIGSWRYSYPNTVNNDAPAAHLDSPDATSDFVIENWATTIDSIEIANGQKQVVLYHLKIDNSVSGKNGAFYVHDGSAASAEVCYLDSGGLGSASRSIYVKSLSIATMKACIAFSANNWVMGIAASAINITNSWFDGGGLVSSKPMLAFDDTTTGPFLSSRVDNPIAERDAVSVSSNSSILFGWNAHGGNYIDDGAGNVAGIDLLIETGGGVRFATNANNTYNGAVGKTVTAATYGWES